MHLDFVSIIFLVLFFAIFGRLFLFALKMSWGILKFFLGIIFLPVILMGLFVSGMLFLGFPLLLVIGAVVLFKTLN